MWKTVLEGIADTNVTITSATMMSLVIIIAIFTPT
jgi:hypothetical protein